MTPDDVLELYDEAATEEYTTAEVATALDVSKPAAWTLLDRLAREGLLARRSGTGLRSDTWLLTDAGKTRLDGGSES